MGKKKFIGNNNLYGEIIISNKFLYNKYKIVGGDSNIQFGMPFTTEWMVAGDAVARTITLPLVSGYSYNCVVDWGDDTTPSLVISYNDTNRIHTYAGDGTYNVKIYGICQGWSFNNGGDKLKIIDIINYGSPPIFGGFAYLGGGFYGCTNLKSLGPINSIIPDDGLLNIDNGFRDSGVTGQIPPNLIRQLTSATNLGSLLRNCSGLTGSIPTDFLRYVTSATSLNSLLHNCSGLTGSIPTDFLRYVTSATSLNSLLRDCSGLTGYDADLCRENVLCTDFSYMMYGCIAMQQRSDTFYRPGEEGTRFLNQSSDFTSCFERGSFTGTQGSAPDLWNCTFGTGTPTTTNCWAGAGNSTTSLSNYASIPSGWK